MFRSDENENNFNFPIDYEQRKSAAYRFSSKLGVVEKPD
jgi:hypothetical protein